VPIYSGIYGQCSSGGEGAAVTRLTYPATAVSNVSPGSNVTGAAGSPNLDAILGDYSLRDFQEDVSVYLNGQRMVPGSGPSNPEDVYPGDDRSTGDLKFTRRIKVDDEIIMDIFPPAL